VTEFYDPKNLTRKWFWNAYVICSARI